MTIFDLVFIGAFLASAVTFVRVVFFAARGRWQRARGLLASYGVGAGVYLAVLGGVSLASPQRVLAIGEDRCFDDWCVAVDDVQRSATATDTAYRLTFRLSSRARGVSQRETGLAVYLLDEKGRRYDPLADSSATPFDAVLQPGQSLTSVRTFRVAGQTGRLGVVVDHGASCCSPGRVIIGDDESLLHKPTLVRLP